MNLDFAPSVCETKKRSMRRFKVSALRHTSEWLARGFGWLAKTAKCLRKRDPWPKQGQKNQKTSQDTLKSQDPTKNEKKKKTFGSKDSRPMRLAPTWLPLLLLSLCRCAGAACDADTPKLFGASPNELVGCFQDFPPWPLNLSLGDNFSGFVEESSLVAFMAPRAPGASRLGNALCHDAAVCHFAYCLRLSSRAAVTRLLQNVGLGGTVLCLFWLFNQKTLKKKTKKGKKEKRTNSLFREFIPKKT